MNLLLDSVHYDPKLQAIVGHIYAGEPRFTFKIPAAVVLASSLYKGDRKEARVQEVLDFVRNNAMIVVEMCRRQIFSTLKLGLKLDAQQPLIVPVFEQVAALEIQEQKPS